jgi:hypothetical protein
MPTLPAHLNLDQLRHQARDLLRAAKADDPEALNEIRRASDRVTLEAAQPALARRYGFASSAKLKTAVEARNVELAEQAIAFCQASVNRIGVAARMLAATPELAEHSFAIATPISKPATQPGTTRRSAGPQSEAATNPTMTPPPTGSKPSEHCSSTAPPPTK